MAEGTSLIPTTLSAWILAIGAVGVFTYVVSSILAWRRLHRFNGPISASFSYLWIMRASYSGRMGERWAEADAKYGTGPGSTVRIGPNELLTSDADVIRRTSAARTKYTRSEWYKLSTIDPYCDAMLSTLDTAAHDKIKAQTAPGYTGKDHPNLEGEVDGILTQLVDKIRSKYARDLTACGEEGAKKPLLDLATMAQYFTLDSISKVAFGEEFGLIREERDIHGHLAMLTEVAAPTVTVAVNPYLRAIMGSKAFLMLMGPKPEDKRGVGRIMGWASPSAPCATGKLTGRQNRQGDRGKALWPRCQRTERHAGVLPALSVSVGWERREDLLDQGSFIRHGLSQRQCETEALIQIIAGSDTTATTIRATMLYLMSTPRAYHTLQAEIDEGIRASKVSSPVTNAEANELPYLQVGNPHPLSPYPSPSATGGTNTS
jgi:hypothetical protein